VRNAAMKIEPIDRDPELSRLNAELAALEHRIEETRQRRLRAEAIRRGVPARSSPMDLARSMIAGGSVPAIDPARELQACDREEGILLRAIREVSEAIDNRRDDLSFEEASRLQPAYREILRAAFKAMQETYAAFEAATQVRRELRDAGFGVSIILPDHVPPAVLSIGRLGEGKQLDHWKNAVEVYVNKL
jgi:hypothetical protein